MSGPVLTSAPGSNFHINLLFDASTDTAPTGFDDQIIEAAQFLDALFTDNVTLNFKVGWGEIDGDLLPRMQAVAEGGPSEIFGFYYTDVLGFMQAHATATGTAADQSAIAALPTNDPLGTPDQQNWWITPSQLKLFDAADYPSDLTYDGAIGFSKAWTSDWLGAALHELTHAMARISGVDGTGDNYDPTWFDLLRYSAPGTLKLSSGAAYFSVDGGATDLANFGLNSDTSDFLNDSVTPYDPFDEYASSDAWTALDSKVMDVLGFTLYTAPPPPPPPPTKPDLVMGKFTVVGQTAAWTITNSGGGFADPTVTALYLSTDNKIKATDTLLATYSTPLLQIGQSDHESLSFTLPDGLTPGVYYLGAIANQTQTVSESSIANDVSKAVAFLLGDDGANALKATSTVHDVLALGGDDTLTAGAGSDMLDGGAGLNTAVLPGVYSSYQHSQSGGADVFAGPSGTDTLTNIQIVDFKDRQVVLGSDGQTLTARATKDILVGGAGDDTLIASPGKDVLTGGGGDDHFVFTSLQEMAVKTPDQITDFVSGQDLIDISALDSLLAGGSFHLGATAGHVGDITLKYDATNHRTVVDIFTNGDAKPDGAIWLSGNHLDLSGTDFVL